MENSLKQRIVGAVVLIGLAVIFLPAVLKEKSQQGNFKSEIPPKPAGLIEQQITSQDVKANAAVSQKLDEIASSERKRKAEQATNPVNNDDLNVAIGDQPGAKTTQSKLTDTKASTDSGEQSRSKTKRTDPNATQSKVTPKTADQSSEKAQTLDKNYRDAAWLIKVASFSSLENAKRLVDNLKKAGYKAYRRDGKASSGQKIFRVYVGPYVEKSKAAEAAPRISQISQSQAILLVFDPIKH